MSLFGDRLRSEREARGWTQVDTAKKLNVNNATWGNYEAGRREPGFEFVRSASRLFGCSIDYLMGETDNRKRDDPPILPPELVPMFRGRSWNQLCPETKREVFEYIQWKLAMEKRKSQKEQ